MDILNIIWSIDKNIQVQISTNGLNLREIAGFDDPNNLESIHISRHHYDDKKNIETQEVSDNESNNVVDEILTAEIEEKEVQIFKGEDRPIAVMIDNHNPACGQAKL